MTNVARRPFRPSPRLIGLIIAVALSPVFWFFAYFGQPARGVVMVSALGVILAVSYIRRDIISRPFFWIVISVFGVVNFALAILLPLPPRFHMSIIVLPFALVDAFIGLAALWVVNRISGPRSVVRAP